jgi:hypothetical protein
VVLWISRSQEWSGEPGLILFPRYSRRVLKTHKLISVVKCVSYKSPRLLSSLTLQRVVNIFMRYNYEIYLFDLHFLKCINSIFN